MNDLIENILKYFKHLKVADTNFEHFQNKYIVFPPEVSLIIYLNCHHVLLNQWVAINQLNLSTGLAANNFVQSTNNYLCLHHTHFLALKLRGNVIIWWRYIVLITKRLQVFCHVINMISA